MIVVLFLLTTRRQNRDNIRNKQQKCDKITKFTRKPDFCVANLVLLSNVYDK